eukprot:scaffold15611_cov110-Isochrysis_galbana.AAC.7
MGGCLCATGSRLARNTSAVAQCIAAKIIRGDSGIRDFSCSGGLRGGGSRQAQVFDAPICASYSSLAHALACASVVSIQQYCGGRRAHPAVASTRARPAALHKACRLPVCGALSKRACVMRHYDAPPATRRPRKRPHRPPLPLPGHEQPHPRRRGLYRSQRHCTCPLDGRPRRCHAEAKAAVDSASQALASPHPPPPLHTHHRHGRRLPPRAQLQLPKPPPSQPTFRRARASIGGCRSRPSDQPRAGVRDEAHVVDPPRGRHTPPYAPGVPSERGGCHAEDVRESAQQGLTWTAWQR